MTIKGPLVQDGVRKANYWGNLLHQHVQEENRKSSQRKVASLSEEITQEDRAIKFEEGLYELKKKICSISNQSLSVTTKQAPSSTFNLKMAMTPGNLSAIADLFKEPDDASDSDEDKPVTSTTANLGPGSIGPEKKIDESKEDLNKNHKDIWSAEEVPEGSEYDSLHDPRPQPEYDIMFSQSVTSEDIFLQMGNKTPMSSSCENMTVKIKLPNTKMADVELDVKTKFLDCRSPKYKLGLHLPHAVDPKAGKAQWDGKTETLVVTLRMNREYDMFNF